MTTLPRLRPGVVLAAVAVLVIAVIVVVAVFVVPALLRTGGSATRSDVADIGSKPRLTWTFDWVGDADSEFLEDAPGIAAVGDNGALVWARFDTYAYTDSQGDSVGWYDGYDEQYADGYAAGLEYEKAYETWVDDTTFTLPLPREEDYYPEGAYGDLDAWLGFDDGFWDARLGQREGASKKQQPIDPDYSPRIALIGTTTGDVKWTVDLAKLIDGVDFSSTFTAFDIPGSDAIAISTSTTSDDATSYTVATVSAKDGALISHIDSPDPLGADAFGGDLVVSTSDSDSDDTAVARYRVDGLGGDPLWETVGPDSSFGATVYALGDDYVQVLGDDDGVILSAHSGTQADFGDDAEFSLTYSYADRTLLRTESLDETVAIEGWTTSGRSRWDGPVEADYARVIDGTIFTAEGNGDSYATLTAIDPASGDERWPQSWDGEFDAVPGVRGGSVLVISGTTLIALDERTGQKRYSQKVGDVDAIYQGDASYYIYAEDTLAAYSYTDKGASWSYRLDDDLGIVKIGRSLGVIDNAEGTLRGLAAR